MCLASYDDPESLSTPNGTTSSEPVKEEEAQKQ
jgi:hypothetical protein